MLAKTGLILETNTFDFHEKKAKKKQAKKKAKKKSKPKTKKKHFFFAFLFCLLFFAFVLFFFWGDCFFGILVNCFFFGHFIQMKNILELA